MLFDGKVLKKTVILYVICKLFVSVKLFIFIHKPQFGEKKTRKKNESAKCLQQQPTRDKPKFAVKSSALRNHINTIKNVDEHSLVVVIVVDNSVN